MKNNSEGFFAAITSASHIHCRFFRSHFPAVLDRPDVELYIAFTMVIHKDILQVARLLRMIHRINNYYCIHLDARSTRTLREAVEGMARCFGANVELVPPEKRVAVVWGDESVLRPQLICGEQALERHQTWKYLINIVGQEFPLRTNLELIAALKALNGSNLVEAFSIDRFRRWVKNDTLPLQPMVDWDNLAGSVWLTKLYKGSVYGAFRRDFIQEAVLSPALSPIRDTLLRHGIYPHPDELFFPSLNYNPHLRLPGSCLTAPPPAEEVGLGYLAKYVIWDGYGMVCPTKYVQSICIFGVAHIPVLQKAPHLFANKFQADFEPLAYDEMENWYFDKLRQEMKTGTYDANAFDQFVFSILDHHDIAHSQLSTFRVPDVPSRFVFQPFHDQSTIPEPNGPSRGLNPHLLADGHLSPSGCFTCEFRHTSTMLPVSRYTPPRSDHTQLL
ncbi:hypothetical protein Aperf_G00000123114 [Anoplocephala perfoliata]